MTVYPRTGPSEKPLTGRKVFLIFFAAFGVIIAANLVLAYNAVRSFPGLEVRNSYVASQRFDAERAAQEALGWEVSAALTAGGLLRVAIHDSHGVPVAVESLSATIGRPTERGDDRVLVLERGSSGYGAAVDLAPGKWHLWLAAVAQDGTPFRQRLTLTVAQTDGGRG